MGGRRLERIFGGVWPSSDELWRELQVHDPNQALAGLVAGKRGKAITTNPNPRRGTNCIVLWRTRSQRQTSQC